MSQRERVCVTAKRQNQGVPQEVSVREGSEWCLGMCSCWQCVSTVEAMALPYTQHLLVINETRKAQADFQYS